MDDPSKPEPSVKTVSVSSSIGIVKCCQVPGKSTNFRSTMTALFFFAKSNTSFAVIKPSFKIESPMIPLNCGPMNDRARGLRLSQILFDPSGDGLVDQLAAPGIIDFAASLVGDIEDVDHLVQPGRDPGGVDGQAQVEDRPRDHIEQALAVVGEHVDDRVPRRRVVVHLYHRRLA